MHGSGQTVFNLLSKEAKKRQATSTGGANPQLKGKFPEAEKGQARDQAAKIAQVDGRMIDHARKVVEKGAPELQEAVARGDIAVSVAKELTALPKEKQVDVVAKNMGTRFQLLKRNFQRPIVEPTNALSLDHRRFGLHSIFLTVCPLNGLPVNVFKPCRFSASAIVSQVIRRAPFLLRRIVLMAWTTSGAASR